MDVLTLSVVKFFAAWIFCIVFTAAAPVITTDAKAIMYLQKYGYMEKPNSSLLADSSPIVEKAVLSKAIKDFQNFAGLSETGVLDEPTLDLMSKPRCGVPDKVGHTGSSRRKKRFALHGSKWNKKSLTYRISKYPKSIEDLVFQKPYFSVVVFGNTSVVALVDKEIAKAFKVWSDVTGLNFEVSEASPLFSNPVDIEIRFEEGKHGHIIEFDGPGGTLAHAYYPQDGGDVHFDDAERWTSAGLFSGTNLFQVAAHEFGHSLGLQHSKIKIATMYPYYSYKFGFTLHEDDVLGIQKLYGPPMKFDAPDLCRNSSIDAVTDTMDGHIYVFKETYYWKIGETGIIDGYPRKISDDWPGLPGNLDAALTAPDGKTYFFKKNQYWRFYNRDIDSGFPKKIAVGLRGIPDDIDTALFWNDVPYFFKGDESRSCYFRSGEIKWCTIGVREPIHDFSEGLPTDIDAAFRWKNEKTYIIKGSKYYRINDKAPSTVAEADPPYPRSTSVWWFGCPDLCQDSSIDAATTTEDGKTYVFKGKYYWGIEETGISAGYPRKISDDWPGLPGDLDAATNMSNGRTYFFKKNLYWRYNNKTLDSGYPKHISDGVPGIPDDIDFTWSQDDNIFFFKGDYYWRFEFGRVPHVRDHYPQPISNWQGLPNNIDTALRWRDNTYFFKGRQYYKWNDKTANVAIADPPYPRSTYLWWFNCEDSKKAVEK